MTTHLDQRESRHRPESGVEKLPRQLAAFHNFHAGETIIVCGCGNSLTELRQPERFLTIGVNDVGRLFDPTYLVALNSRQQFQGDRFQYVENSRAQAVFTQLDLGIRHPHVVRVRLGTYGGTDFGDPNVLHYTRNSPYVALCLAVQMGAKRIGLIGVDFTDHHFFARTGRHSLAGDFERINREYTRLARACTQMGIEIVNLSRESRLTAFPKGALDDVPAPVDPGPSVQESEEHHDASRPPRVFFVNYQFLSCGDVFTKGLRNAAHELGIPCDDVDWDDPRLPDRVSAFAPDLLFVVHGRKFIRKWRQQFSKYNSAVWLVDEPYEVDDTSSWSGAFDTVFVNDSSTLGRHPNSHYLPVACDPLVYREVPGEKPYAVGFVGGYNPTRERLLLSLLEADLLSYVVGGPWKSGALRKICPAGNVPPAETAALYQQTRIIVNVFRDGHHYNRSAVPACSLNPRVYEALACGALVVSEPRPEFGERFPAVPLFTDQKELVQTVRELLTDEGLYRSRLRECREHLAGNSYTDRLREVLSLCIHRAHFRTLPARPPTPLDVNRGADHRPPTYSIIMVVHNGLEMTRMSTLRTLRHSAGEDARLIVVDNASTDGARDWLQTLSRRGDIDLIRTESNIGHGPGLELARRAARGSYLVTLDSDAFPLRHDWLRRLRSLLTDRVRVAGIRHHRDYIHPSCLLIARETMREFGLSFLKDTGPGGQLDVAEPISRELKRRHFEIAGLTRSAARRRGSASEPVYLGSEYEGLVYHQWYTTRAERAPGRAVDDVPRQAIEESLREAFAEFDDEPRELTVVIGVRAPITEPERLRNARAVLQALNDQDLERWRYRIVLVEQDETPRLEGELAPLADRYVFAFNPGAYNRGWAFNIGASLPASRTGVLCLMDADLLPPPDFCSTALSMVRDGTKAVLPYNEVIYLSSVATELAISDRVARPREPFDTRRYKGRRFTTSQGGCIWMDAALYHEIGGHDERFRGWGGEDRDFYSRLSRATEVKRAPVTLLHLDHPRPAEHDAHATANQQLLKQDCPARYGEMIGNPALYAAEVSERWKRDWENWDCWDRERIRRIVVRERRSPRYVSARWWLAEILVRLGDNLLDLGCGPGAMWTHFERYRPGFSWVGADTSRAMLAVARDLFPEVPLCHADGGRLPFADRSFDVVLLRHVLEHLPEWLMQATLTEGMRVGRRAVVVDFFVPPVRGGAQETTRVGENFLQTRWTTADIEAPIAGAQWAVREKLALKGTGDPDQVWIVTPQDEDVPLDDIRNLLRSEAGTTKVSIIMPTYRRRHTLLRTVDTVRAQTYENWELIIIDNAGDVGEGLNDPRIQVYRHTERPSASYARNAGLQYATGDLICFFDDDDDMFPTYLERFVHTFRVNRNAKMVRCGMLVSSNRTDFSYATPECCFRREFATPTWSSAGPAQDQRYFRQIVAKNRWSEQRGDILIIREALCRANSDPNGGLRSGGF